MKAYILAGGESSRMGQNKALLDINGSPLIEIIANQLSGFEEVIIIGRKETYSHLDYRVIEDIIPSLITHVKYVRTIKRNSNASTNTTRMEILRNRDRYRRKRAQYARPIEPRYSSSSKWNAR